MMFALAFPFAPVIFWVIVGVFWISVWRLKISGPQEVGSEKAERTWFVVLKVYSMTLIS